jgi:hypothetical protein
MSSFSYEVYVDPIAFGDPAVEPTLIETDINCKRVKKRKDYPGETNFSLELCMTRVRIQADCTKGCAVAEKLMLQMYKREVKV